MNDYRLTPMIKTWVVIDNQEIKVMDEVKGQGHIVHLTIAEI